MICSFSILQQDEHNLHPQIRCILLDVEMQCLFFLSNPNPIPQEQFHLGKENWKVISFLQMRFHTLFKNEMKDNSIECTSHCNFLDFSIVSFPQQLREGQRPEVWCELISINIKQCFIIWCNERVKCCKNHFEWKKMRNDEKWEMVWFTFNLWLYWMLLSPSLILLQTIWCWRKIWPQERFHFYL